MGQTRNFDRIGKLDSMNKLNITHIISYKHWYKKTVISTSMEQQQRRNKKTDRRGYGDKTKYGGSSSSVIMMSDFSPLT